MTPWRAFWCGLAALVLIVAAVLVLDLSGRMGADTQVLTHIAQLLAIGMIGALGYSASRKNGS